MSKFEELVAAAQMGDTDICLGLMSEGTSILSDEKSIFDYVSIVDDNFYVDTLSDIMDEVIQDKNEFPKFVAFLNNNPDLTNDLANLDKSTVGYLIAFLPQENNKIKEEIQSKFNDIDENSDDKISSGYLEMFGIIGGNFYMKDDLLDEAIKDQSKLDKLVNLLRSDKNLTSDLAALERKSALKLIAHLPEEIKEEIRTEFNKINPENSQISLEDLNQKRDAESKSETSKTEIDSSNSNLRRLSVRRKSVVVGEESSTTNSRRLSSARRASVNTEEGTVAAVDDNKLTPERPLNPRPSSVRPSSANRATTVVREKLH